MTTDQHRDKDQQNYLLDQARTILDEIEVSVFGPSGMDTPSCAKAWPTAKLIAALIHRIEALEDAKPADSPPQLNHPEIPGGLLMTRVEDALYESCTTSHGFREEARAAIRAVAKWLSQESSGHLGSGKHWARRLQQEAER